MSHQICNFASGHPLDVVLVSNPRFLSMGIHWEPVLEASDRPEGQELGGGAVGGQEVLQEVKFIASWHYRFWHASSCEAPEAPNDDSV